ncbi:diphthine--ammonia ligase [uncultured Tenacibaculum sp.]|uniref:Dph6-related ATP pyrophosphatase n=1 Tax=uncultured Tenacibaculum sp. TaxID=174713 RepID=UPI002608FACC|nr:diphthine--ammonia ligase [uncultured Tenacibaculum sp.]
MKQAFFNWSSGKDSAFALYKVLQDKEYVIKKLLTNVNEEYRRISMHGLREELLDEQVKAIGFPSEKLYFPAQVTMEMYNQKMKETLTSFKDEHLDYAIFGDIFLEDLKKYRDQKLAEVGLKGVYPLWKRDTKELLKEFLQLGFKTITVCVNAKLLGKEFVGRIIDEDFINELPDNIDPCGENGEFHTFCFDGPIFKNPVKFEVGEKVLKSYTLNEDDDQSCHTDTSEDIKEYDTSFWYCDLIPV